MRSITIVIHSEKAEERFRGPARVTSDDAGWLLTIALKDPQAAGRLFDEVQDRDVCIEPTGGRATVGRAVGQIESCLIFSGAGPLIEGDRPGIRPGGASRGGSGRDRRGDRGSAAGPSGRDRRTPETGSPLSDRPATVRPGPRSPLRRPAGAPPPGFETPWRPGPSGFGH